MTWIDVQSSNVAQVAYDADIALLGVRYKDGAVYLIPNMPARVWDALQAAESKGRYLARIREPMIRVGKEVSAVNPVEPLETERVARESGPLNVIDEDADKCCRRGLEAFFRNDTRFTEPWVCGDCGQKFRPDVIDIRTIERQPGEPSTMISWRIVPLVAIVRPR